MTKRRRPKVHIFQDRASWLAGRRRGIGASDAAKILGESNFGDTISLWMNKTGRTEDEEELSDPDAVEFGNLLQPLVAGVFAKRTGRTVTNPENVPNGHYVIHEHPEFPFLLASLDYVQTAKEHQGPGVLEIKTGNHHTGRFWEDEAPTGYLIQIQHQMGVLGYSWGSLAVLIGGQDFRWLDIEFDPEFFELLLEKEAEFWEHVLDDTPPPPVGDKSDKALAKLYKVGDGSTILLPGEAKLWDEELDQIEEEQKRLKKREKELRAALKAHIGNHTFGRIPDTGVVWSWKEVHKKAYTVKESVSRQLRRKESST